MHTVADRIVPVEHERPFSDRGRASSDGTLPRQAYAERQGPWMLTTAGTIAALHALDHHVPTGHRGGDAATPAALGFYGEACVPYRPAVLTVGRDAPACAHLTLKDTRAASATT